MSLVQEKMIVSESDESIGTAVSAPSSNDISPSPLVTEPPRRDMDGGQGQWWLFNVAIPLVLLAAAAGVVYLLGTVQPDTRPPDDMTRVGRLRALPAAITVPVQSLAASGEKLHLNSDGLVVPFREVTLATEVAGRVIEKSPQCEAGRYVTEGTVLIRIDPTDYELEVERLMRMREQEYEALGEVDQEMINARRSMTIADAEIQLQQREVTRLESLPKSFASQGELDQARRALLQVEQQKVNYQNQLDLLKNKRSRLEATERLAATQLRAAEVNLQRTAITAPIDGVIVQEDAELNTFVARGSPVVTVEDTSSVEVSASLRSDQLFWVLNQDRSDEVDPLAFVDSASDDAGQLGYRLPTTPVRVIYQVANREETRFVWNGELLGYDGIGLDEQTRTIPVRVLVREPRRFVIERDGQDPVRPSNTTAGPKALVRGMFVSLQLELDPAVPLIMIPAEALRPGNRIWEFEPDETVLNAAVTPSGVEPSVSADAEDLPAFDADAWTPGRLEVHGNIRPVDSITRDGADLWICEAPDGTLEDGSFVITSPLGSVTGAGLAIRTPRTD
ncbi:MAG: HlyD family efflux transporter periplasmic adaptor subunit [Planctomycetota bacterium]